MTESGKQQSRFRRLAKRLFFSFVILVTLLMIAEFIARLHPASRDLGVLFKEVSPGNYRYELNKQDVVFKAPKPDDVYRIFCFGGSATMGSIYNPVSGFPQHLELMLTESAKGGRVQVINTGKNAFNSDQVRATLRESLRFQPDMLVVYAGNNELTQYRAVNQVETPLLYSIKVFLLQNSRLYTVLNMMTPDAFEMAAARFREDADVPPDVNLYPPSRREIIRENYLINMKKMVRLAREQDVPIIISTTANNVREWPPTKSWYPEKMTSKKRALLRDKCSEAEEYLHENKFSQAESLIDQVLSAHSSHARARFIKGKLELEKGEVENARRQFYMALDNNDARIMRAPSSHQRGVREIAEKHDVPLVDMHRVFNRKSAHGLAGFELLDDYCHANLEGQAVMAAEFAEKITRLDADRFRPADSAKLIKRTSKWTEKVGITEQFMAQRTQEMAFFLAFAHDDRFVNDQAVKVFDRMKKYTEASALPHLGKALLYFRFGNDTKGKELLGEALRTSEDHTQRMADLYFSEFLQVDLPFIMLKAAPGTDFRQVLREYLVVIGVQKSRGQKRLEPRQADRLYWLDQESGALQDLTRQLHEAIAERRRLAESKTQKTRHIYGPQNRNNIKAVNMQRQSPGVWRATASDPQLVFNDLTVGPLQAGSIRVRAKIEVPGDKAEEICLYWRTQRAAHFSEKLKQCIEIRPDTKEEFVFPLGKDPAWILIDNVPAIRLDPFAQQGTIELDAVEIIPFAPPQN